MCGILGYYGKSYEDFKHKFSLEVIKHRGPDSQGKISSNNFYLGHTRLSIQDLSENGAQPMFSVDKKYVIIFNGEIYNHLELRSRYLSEINFISTSDTETVLFGLIKYGEEFINKLNGIFAFSFLNILDGDFIIVRDQFGVKPLYYFLNHKELYFTSELKSILSFSKSSINRKAIANYINYLWSPGEDTPLSDYKKLLPGHLIKGNFKDLEAVSIKRYYHIEFNDKNILQSNENKLIDLCETHLLNAVKRQMLSDVPVGFFLSGGLDSSLIVAMAKKLFPSEKFECFTINAVDFEDEGFSNDLDYAIKVAKYLDVNLNIVDGSNNILEYFDKVVYHLDEPQADPAPINVYNICKEAREKGVKVLLGGTAGDDLFSGYRRHQALSYEKYFTITPFFLRRIIKKFIKNLKTKESFTRRLVKLLKNIDLTQDERMFSYFDWIDIETLEGLFTDEIKYDKHSYFKKLLKDLPKDTSLLNTMLYLEMNTFLVDHNLNYTDKLSMATGVEVRVPFLDKELVEFSTKIPVNLKLKGSETKYILKKVAERYLPHDVIYRPKTGFGAPVRKWILNDMKPLINKYLSEEKINERGIFDFSKIQKLIKDNEEGIVDASYSIWALIAIESWLQQFTNQNPI